MVVQYTFIHAYTLNAHIHVPPLHTHIHTGLAGANDIENAQIYVFVNEITDLLEATYKSFFEKDEAKKVFVH